jgi:hypothetical protein
MYKHITFKHQLYFIYLIHIRGCETEVLGLQSYQMARPNMYNDAFKQI